LTFSTENNPGIVQNSISSNQSVTVLGQEQTFHKFDVHSFSILPLILVFTVLFMLEQSKNLYRHILLEILLPPPRGEQGADYSSSSSRYGVNSSTSVETPVHGG
jgi:hypothetical protein